MLIILIFNNKNNIIQFISLKLKKNENKMKINIKITELD